MTDSAMEKQTRKETGGKASGDAEVQKIKKAEGGKRREGGILGRSRTGNFSAVTEKTSKSISLGVGSHH